MELKRFKGNPILKPKEENEWERGQSSTVLLCMMVN